MKASNKKYKTNIHISWKLILILLVFTGFLYGSVDSSQIRTHKGKIKLKGSGGHYTGSVVDKYQNGQKKSEKTYRKGKRDGKQTYWYENGQKEKEGTYKDGNGKSTYWDKDGNIIKPVRRRKIKIRNRSKRNVF